MIRAAAANGWIDERAAALESLTSIRRAGADIVLTYWAAERGELVVVTGPVAPGMPTGPQPPTRPVDVDTGFWLWLVAVPLMVIGYVADMVGSSNGRVSAPLYVASRAFHRGVVRDRRDLPDPDAGRLPLGPNRVDRRRHRHRRLPRDPAVHRELAADVRRGCGIAGITGSVLIAGGMFLLHRRDAHDVLHQVRSRISEVGAPRRLRRPDPPSGGDPRWFGLRASRG